MADPRSETILVQVPLRKNDDPELTCFVCHSRESCDYATSHRAPGRHVTIGVHLACVKELGIHAPVS